MIQSNEAEAESAAVLNQSSAGSISLIRGGPFYRAQEALRLVDAGRWNLGRRIAVAILIGWLPLLLLTLTVNPRAVPGLLRDYPVNARMLIAVPVLLAGQLVMEGVFRKIVLHIGVARLLSPRAMEEMDRILVRLIRLRDSAIPETVIVIAAVARAWSIVHGGDLAVENPWAMAAGPTAQLTLAGWYYELISQFVFLFLFGINLWKWLLWAVFLFRLSRLDLQLFATHPDKNGGLGFLGMSSIAIAPTVFVSALAIGSTWREEILLQSHHLMDFKIDAVGLLTVVLAIALGPLVFFVSRLSRLRRQAILDYGALAQMHSANFHQKWILHRAGHEEEFITAPDSSSLIDFASSFENIQNLKPFPFDKGALVALVIAIAAPMLPVVLAEIPLAEVLKGLLSALK